MLAFSLLFMYNLGGDYAGLSGLATAFMTMIPTARTFVALLPSLPPSFLYFQVIVPFIPSF